MCECVREEKDRKRDLSPGGYDKHYDYGRKERQRDESKLLFKESDIYRNGVDGRLARLCRVRVGELQYRARDFKGAGDVRVETFRLRATSENNVTRKRVTPDIRGKKNNIRWTVTTTTEKNGRKHKIKNGKNISQVT